MDPIQKLRAWMAKSNLDGVVVGKRNNFSWLTGGRQNYIVNQSEEGVGYLLITPTDQYIGGANIEMDRLMQEEVGSLGFKAMPWPWWKGQEGSDLEKLMKGSRFGSDVGWGGTTDVAPDLQMLRMTLSKAERENYLTLSEETAAAIEQVCREVTPGTTEEEIRAAVACQAHMREINPVVILIASDERIYKYRHPIATRKKLDRYLMVVICGERYGLVTSATRFVHFGAVEPELLRKSEAVARIDAGVIAATTPGKTYVELFKELQGLYASEGYPQEWQLHHQGGPTGYAPREFLVTPTTPGEIGVNQAFAWNPSITGAKSEDTVLVTETGSHILSATGQWPTIDVKIGGAVISRPAILVR